MMAGMITMADVILHELLAGPYAGQKIGVVAATDDGLLELERLALQPSANGFDLMYLEVFFADPEVQRQAKAIKDARMNQSK